MANLLLLQGTVVLVCFLVYRQCFRKRGGPSLPPGPKPLPLIGNFRDLPPAGVPEFQNWLKHKEIYGPVSSVTVLGQSLVLLHDKQAAHDLLDKESKKCSGRPIMEFAYLCSLSKFVVSRQFDDTFRLHRKLIGQGVGSKAAVTRYNDVIEVEVRRFLLRTLNEPHKMVEHLQTEASTIILKIAYGYTAEANKADPLSRLIGNMMDNFSAALVPMSWMVDIIPALKYLPDYFPGTGFKETARRWKAITLAVINTPYDFARQQMANDSNHTSYVSNIYYITWHDSSINSAIHGGHGEDLSQLVEMSLDAGRGRLVAEQGMRFLARGRAADEPLITRGTFAIAIFCC